MTFVVVDDVLFARKAVEKMILEWDSGSEILASCGDGLEAVALMEQRVPDVLITDIRMPGSDGLALAQIAQQRWPQINIILVTGYASFDYARRAISSGVRSYLLKPLKKQELFKALDALNGELVQHAARETHISAIRHRAESFLLTHYLTSGGLSGEVPAESAERCADGFALAQISAPGREPAELCAEAGRIFGEGVECHEDILHSGSALVLLYAPQKGNLESLSSAAYRGLRLLTRTLRRNTPGAAVSVSAMESGASALPQAYTQARRALCMRLAHPEWELYPFACMQTEGHLFTPDELRALRTRMQAGRWSDASTLVLACLQNVEGVPQLEHGYQELLTLCYGLYSERSDAAAPRGRARLRQLWDFTTREELWSYMQAFASESAPQPAAEASDVVEELKAFLEENYYCELSLNELATKKYFMNPNYMSRLFKAKTGKGFSRYLTEVRMRKAQELLQTSELSIAEVASLVGYTSPSHFIQSFKKMFGETPGSHKTAKQNAEMTFQ